MREASSVALEAATCVQAAQETAGNSACPAGDSDQPTAPASYIMDRLKSLVAPYFKMKEVTPRFPPPAVNLFTHNTSFKMREAAPRFSPLAMNLFTHNTSFKVREAALRFSPLAVNLFTHNTPFKGREAALWFPPLAVSLFTHTHTHTHTHTRDRATSPKAQYGVIPSSHISYKFSLFLGYHHISDTNKAYLLLTKIYTVT